MFNLDYQTANGDYRHLQTEREFTADMLCKLLGREHGTCKVTDSKGNLLSVYENGIFYKICLTIHAA